jgi:hypothetical protein
VEVSPEVCILEVPVVVALVKAAKAVKAVKAAVKFLHNNM